MQFPQILHWVAIYMLTDGFKGIVFSSVAWVSRWPGGRWIVEIKGTWAADRWIMNLDATVLAWSCKKQWNNWRGCSPISICNWRAMPYLGVRMVCRSRSGARLWRRPNGRWTRNEEIQLWRKPQLYSFQLYYPKLWMQPLPIISLRKCSTITWPYRTRRIWRMVGRNTRWTMNCKQEVEEGIGRLSSVSNSETGELQPRYTSRDGSDCTAVSGRGMIADN